MASINEQMPDDFSMHIREAVGNAIAKLDEREQWLIEAVYVRGMSYKDISTVLNYKSKASAHKAVQDATDKLKDILLQDKDMVRFLRRKGNGNMSKHQYWQDASWEAVRCIDRCSVHDAMPEMFDIHFHNLGLLVRAHGEEEAISDICFSVGCEASRVLNEMGAWDIELMQDTLCKKQHDYGHENINAFGIIGIAVRISDKIARYKNLQDRANSVADETFLDTLMDMVGYAVLARMLDNGSFHLELEPF